MMEEEDDPFNTLTAAFTAWLPTAGIMLHPSLRITDLRARGAGRGLLTTSDLAEDTLLFTLPTNSSSSSSSSSVALTASTSSLPQALTSHLSPWLQLILALLHESMNPNSPWRAYLDLLPKASDFDTLMYWTEQELGWLRGSKVVDKIGKREATLMFREMLWPVVRDNPGLFGGLGVVVVEGERGEERGEEMVVESAHRWGSVVMAYSFDLDMPDADGADNNSDEDEDDDDDNDDDEERPTIKAMLPVADILNADADLNNARLFQSPTTTTTTTSPLTLSMRTTTAIRAGSEIFNTYGPLPSSDLLRRYGYVTPNHAQYDVVELPSPLFVDLAGAGLIEEEKEERVDWLLDEGILDDAFDIGRDGRVPGEIVVAVKTLLAGRDTPWKKAGRDAGMTPEVARVVAEACRKRLEEYQSTVEEDENLLLLLLRGETLQRRERMAVTVRLGEKRILRDVLEELERVERKREADDGEGEGEGKREGSKGKRARN